MPPPPVSAFTMLAKLVSHDNWARALGMCYMRLLSCTDTRTYIHTHILTDGRTASRRAALQLKQNTQMAGGHISKSIDFGTRWIKTKPKIATNLRRGKSTALNYTHRMNGLPKLMNLIRHKQAIEERRACFAVQ